MKDLTSFSTFSIPLAPRDRYTAEQFAREQPTAEKATQVYCNTLAVLVVHYYLRMLDISVDLKTSYSWNAGCRLGADIADLYLPGKGRLECRPIPLGEATCAIPPEVWADRLGYILVEINESCEVGTILGFVQLAAPTIFRSQLQPLDALLEILHSTPTLVPSLGFIRLNQWLHQVFDPGWQGFEELVYQQQAWAFRTRLAKSVRTRQAESVSVWQPIEQLYSSQETAILQDEHFAPSDALSYLIQRTEDEEVRWKAAELLWDLAPENPLAGIRRVTDLRSQLAGYAGALMVAILPKADQTFALLLRVYPLRYQSYLPAGLQLEVSGQDELGNPVKENVIARESDDYIQLKLIAEPGDRFSVALKLDNARFEEHFMV
ncbi:DUF1822 family protein [Microcoleus sp. FACHB-672]|uniref:DUF1822 family protein n=1 Tax=Microcoleus sp. FACHB-672 TaxID=2692825 RepID=UPI001687FE58|nr:DUF1822 family protein [Microcoleus sp. FACHB-672]MBD2039445.1 DUF1822 family protein [Microcoleus sp. FACHB-672]